MNRIKQIQAQSLRQGFDQTNFLPYAAAAVPVPAFILNRILQARTSAAATGGREGGELHPCLSLYSLMLTGDRRQLPNTHSFTFLFSACAAAATTNSTTGRSLHSHFIKLGFRFDAFTLTSLLQFYSKSDLLSDARRLFDETPDRDTASWNSMISAYARNRRMETALQLFDEMPVRNVISWTSIISGYAQNEMCEEAVQVFIRMWDDGEVQPNGVTLTSVLPACGSLGALDLGERIESYARRNGFVKNVFVSNALMEMYAKCGCIAGAWRVFDEMGETRNLCSWNSMIMGFAVHGSWGNAIELFHKMRDISIVPDGITFTGVLMACTHGGLVEEGQLFFASMEREFHLTPKMEHYGCMVDLLGRAGLLQEAYNLITSMPMSPDAVMWGSLLGACSFHNEVRLAEVASKFLAVLEPWNPGNHVILSNIYASSEQWDSVAKEWKLMKGNPNKKVAGHSLIELRGSIHRFLAEDKWHPESQEVYSLLGDILQEMKLFGQDPDMNTHINELCKSLTILEAC